MKNLQKIYAVVDLETTGASFRKGHRIIQVGITMIQNDQLIQEYNFTVNPGKKIPTLIENLTGISNKDVKNAPYFEDIAAYLHGLLENCIFVAHNIAFDYHFLNQSFEAVGLPKMKLKGIDTVELTKILYPTLKSYRLGDLSQQFGFSHEQAHDAAADARATAQLFLLLKEKAVNLPIVTLERLSELASRTQRDNQEFLELCLRIARERKEPLSERILIKEGLALLKKEISAEQTAYRMKDGLSVEQIWQKGLLSELGYDKRENQQSMSQQVENFFQEEELNQYAIEAPAGMGKTLAYLLPAILKATPEQKVIIATSTLLLQEQLEQELMKVRAVLPFHFRYTSLSSKSHLIDLERFVKLNASELSNTEVLILMSLYVWLTETETGDISELSASHQTGGILDRITYAVADQTGAKKWHDEDFYGYHQKKAERSSILITNHAYLSHHYEEIARSYGEGKPSLIIDESHRFPQSFQNRMKQEIPFSSLKKRVQRFGWDVRQYREYLEDHAAQAYPQYELLNLEFSLDQLYEKISLLEEYLYREEIDGIISPKSKRMETKEIFIDSAVITFGKVPRYLRMLQKQLEEVTLTAERYLDSPEVSKTSTFRFRIHSLRDELEKVRDTLGYFFTTTPYDYYYLSCEVHSEFFHGDLIKGMWNVGETLQAAFEASFTKVLYVSATLFQNGSTAYFGRKIGHPNLPGISFPYKESSMRRKLRIVVPNDIESISETTDEEWITRISCFMIELTQKNKHKMMVLFNSNQALEGVYQKLRKAMDQKDDTIDILAQGFSGSSRRMHRRFLEAEQAILLGSGMYWEGIDFPDQPVEVLIMTRLPFDSPAKPENIAIQRYYDQLGMHSFREEFLPRMLMRFAQGLGRIARKEGQIGTLICLDNRFIKSSYAKQLKAMVPEGTEIIQLPIRSIVSELGSLHSGEEEKD